MVVSKICCTFAPEFIKNLFFMKHKLSSLIVLVILAITAITFQSCSSETYTIWTETDSYSEFISSFERTLDDGYYLKLELSSSQWEDFSKSLTNVDRHKWGESSIKNWLSNHGFDDSKAQKEASWFTTINHGFLVVRQGSQVHFIVK